MVVYYAIRHPKDGCLTKASLSLLHKECSASVKVIKEQAWQ
jgi:hypothetical protein